MDYRIGDPVPRLEGELEVADADASTAALAPETTADPVPRLEGELEVADADASTALAPETMADPVPRLEGEVADADASTALALETMVEACAGEIVWVVMVLLLPSLLERELDLMPTVWPKTCG
jgi:hypothetical protein